MRSRFFDENISNIIAISKKVLGQLKYDYQCSENSMEESAVIIGLKNDYKLKLELKQARKGIVKVTVEVEKPIKTILDYENKKRLEVSLLNSIDTFLQPAGEIELGI